MACAKLGPGYVVIWLAVGLLVGLLVGCAPAEPPVTLTEWSTARQGLLSATISGDASLRAGLWSRLEILSTGFDQLPQLESRDMDTLFIREADTESTQTATIQHWRLLPRDPGVAHLSDVVLRCGSQVLQFPAFDRTVASNFPPGSQPKLEAIVGDPPAAGPPWWLFGLVALVLVLAGGAIWWWRLSAPRPLSSATVDTITQFRAIVAVYQAGTASSASFLALEPLLTQFFPNGLPQNPALSAYLAAVQQEKFQPVKLSLEQQAQLIYALSALLEPQP